MSQPWKLLAVLATAAVGGCTGSNGGGHEQTTDASSEAPTGPAIAGFDFSFAQGDFWEFGWDDHEQTMAWCGGTPASTNATGSGTFKVTLGSPLTIQGTTAYAVEIAQTSVTKGSSATTFTPRWKYLAMSGNKMLGSTDGTTLVPIFDAMTGKWPGGGFFVTFPSGALIVAQKGSIDNTYLSDEDVWVVRQSTDKSQCTYYSGIGTICGSDWSVSIKESEYYAAGTGPVGYSYTGSGGNDDGTCISSFQSARNVGLLASSFSITSGNPFDAGPCPARCGGNCADLSNDTNNCGTCGHVCAGKEPCRGGKCQCTLASRDLTLCTTDTSYRYYCASGPCGAGCYADPVDCNSITKCSGRCVACLTCGQTVDCTTMQCH
jgi:hypothetical protein